MQKIMQNNAAVFRTQETLAEGCDLIDECVESFQASGGVYAAPAAAAVAAAVLVCCLLLTCV